jgi:hypothetical protein
MEEPVSRPYSMSLRQRQIRKSFRAVDGADGTSTAGLEGAALATVAVGLKPGAMGKLERQLFGSRMKEYMKARCAPGSGLAVTNEPCMFRHHLAWPGPLAGGA